MKDNEKALPFFIYFLVLGASIGMGMVRPILPLYVRELGASGFEVGLLVSGFMLARSISSILFGALSDRIGRRPFIYLGLLGLSLTTLLMVFMPHYRFVILLRGLQGFFAGAVWPQLQILVGVASKKSFRARAIGIYFILGSLGMALGNGLASLVLQFIVKAKDVPEVIAAKWVFVIAAVMIFLSISLVRGGEEDGEKSKEGEGEKPTLSSGFWLYVFGFLSGIQLGLFQSIFILHLKEFFGFTMRSVSLLLFIFGITGIVFTYLLSHLADKLDGMRVLRGIIFVSGVASFILPFSRSLALALLMAFLIMSSVRGFMPISRSIVISEGGKRGTKVGALNSVSNLGSVISPLFGGYIYDHFVIFGSKIGIFFLLGCLIMAVLVAELLFRKQ